MVLTKEEQYTLTILEKNFINLNKLISLIKNNVTAIEYKKAKIKIDNHIINYCNKMGYVIIHDLIMIKNKDNFKTKERLEKERLYNLYNDLQKHEKIVENIKGEINKIKNG